MQEAVVPLLLTWTNFYVIIGSAAAALTGLMFVVISLIAGMRRRKVGESFTAYGTPTVVHFCAALLLAAILSAPWPLLWQAGLLLGLIGLGGVIYVIIILRRLRSHDSYKPVLEDWVWHTILPLASYAALLISAIVLVSNPEPALFVVGAAAILFLFSGIHNSWDTVTYIMIEFSPLGSDSQD